MIFTSMQCMYLLGVYLNPQQARKQNYFQVCKMKTNLLSLILTVSMASIVMAQGADLESLDSDSDGKVTVAEFKEYAEGKLQNFDQLDEFAKKVDADGDGEISEDEFAGRMAVLQNMPREAEEKEEEEDKDAENKKAKLDKDVAEAFEKLKKAITKSDFEAASKLMTEKAANEIIMTQLTLAKGLVESEMPMTIPAIEEVAEKLEDVFEKYDLHDLELDARQMFKMEFGSPNKDSGDDEDSDEKSDEKSKDDDSKEDKAKQKGNTQSNVLKELDKKGDRWEILGAIWKAQKGSPFAMNPLKGTIESHEADGDKVFLTVKSAPPGGDENGGMMMVQPPVCLTMEKMKGDWKYSGIDRERTMKSMRKFMQQNGNRIRPPKREQEDF